MDRFLEFAKHPSEGETHTPTHQSLHSSSNFLSPHATEILAIPNEAVVGLSEELVEVEGGVLKTGGYRERGTTPFRRAQDEEGRFVLGGEIKEVAIVIDRWGEGSSDHGL
jgi:hypothetical protein